MAEALAEDKRALELDPLSTIINWNAIGTLCQARRYEEALAQANHALEIDPQSPVVQGSLAHVYELNGDYEGALDAFEQYLPESEGGKTRVAAMRRAYAAGGKTGYWRSVLDYMLVSSRGPTASEVGFAMLHTQVGEFDRAIELLERAYTKRLGDLLFIDVEPLFDPLRSDPRFQSIVRRVGTGSGATP